MTSENYASLYFSDEKIRLTVLTNICRMLVTRGYMSDEKYKLLPDDSQPLDSNKDIKKIMVEQPSLNDKYDNTLFLPYIETITDNNIYTIPLDTPYKDERHAKEETDEASGFDGSMVVVKLIPQEVKDITNSPILNEFLKTYKKYHKIIVFDKMAAKVYTSINREKNAEVFDRDFLMLDMMSHREAPLKCEFVDLTDLNFIANPKVGKLYENEPLSRYFNGKMGMYMRILRPSINNSIEVGYRRIIEPKFVLK
jgi:hypothetical protein